MTSRLGDRSLNDGAGLGGFVQTYKLGVATEQMPEWMGKGYDDRQGNVIEGMTVEPFGRMKSLSIRKSARALSVKEHLSAAEPAIGRLVKLARVSSEVSRHRLEAAWLAK